MQNSMVVFTFSTFLLETFLIFLINEGEQSLLLPVSPYGTRDLQIDNCRQHVLFILLW